MTNTQLRTYPYKRAQIRATLLSLLSDDHIRPISPTTKRLVERNLKAEWCVALSPAPSNDQEVEKEAQIAKQMSTMALQEPAVQHLRSEEANPMNSTLSVNAVAAADLPFKKTRHVTSPTLHEHHVGHSQSRENSRIHGHVHGTVQMPHHEARHSSSHSDHGKAASLSGSVESLPALRKKHRTPPPRPPKKGITQSLPATPPPECETPLREEPSALNVDATVNEEEDKQSIQSAPVSAVEPEHPVKTRFRRAPPPTPHRKRKTSFHG